MAKKLYCSQCGAELKQFIKAVPKISQILTLVEPHECGEVQPIPSGEPFKPLSKEDKKRPIQGQFVQKLNDLDPKITGDKRPKQDLREEKTSAPEGIWDFLDNMKKGE